MFPNGKNDLTMSCATGEALGGNTSGCPEGAADLFPSRGGFVADDGVGGVAGTSTNRCLHNYANSVSLIDSNALKSTSKVDVKYLGIDTVDFSIPLSEDDLSNIEPILLGLVGQGELPHHDRRFVVSLIKLPYRYRVSVADSVELYVPSSGHAYLGMKVSAGARVSLSSDDLESEACEVLGWFLPGDDLAARLRLSRVDTCLDVLMSERTFQHMCRLVARNSVAVVSRGRTKDTYLDADRHTGFWVGKDAVRLRVYDKGLKAGKDGTWAMWSEVYAPGVEGYMVADGYVLVRFEWQLRRKFLSELQGSDALVKVRTLADFKKAAPSILEYLCNDWFKLCGPARGGKHERPMLPVWKAITAGFMSARWTQIEVKVKRVLRRAVPGNEEKLLAMAAGCLASVAAVQGHRSGDDRAKTHAAALGALHAFIGRDMERWQAGRDRRYKQLAYPSKNTHVFADGWVGQPVPVPVGAAVVG